MRKLRFGVLSYLNCLPATLGLELNKVSSEDWQTVRGTPSDLNRMMRRGDLDVSVVSAAEYLDHENRYVLLPGLSLWCDGPVGSVCLYSHLSREQLVGRSGLIGVTSESATSVALTQLLLPGAQTESFPDLESARAGLETGRYIACLLIGDKALSPPTWTGKLKVHDLSAWWLEKTEFPMTFAVWVARSGLSQSRIEKAQRVLAESVSWGEQNRSEVLEVGTQRSEVSRDKLDSYLNRIRFRNTPRSEAGFQEFQGRLRRQRLLAHSPTLVGASGSPALRISSL